MAIRTATALAAILATTLVATDVPARAGTFESLFGILGGDAAPSTATPPERAYPEDGAPMRIAPQAAPAAPSLPAASYGRDQFERALAERRARRRDEARSAAPAGPQGPVTVLDDGTLQPGDAVMTAKGLVVYVGEAGDPETPRARHSASDFVVLRRSGDLVAPADRRRLAALEPTRTAPPSAEAVETGRSAAQVQAPVAGTPVDSPDGRRIRYVGP